MIEAQGLQKHYRVHERPAGLAAALRSVVRRDYRTVRAVDGVSFQIEKGERVGFLGPNGAGKTTTLKMLSGLLHPTAGEARVAGFEPRKRDDAFLRSIMLVTGQKQQLMWDLPPVESFELNRAIYDVPRAQFREIVDEMVALLDLGRVIYKPARQLSLGERMKCELVAALLHRPSVLFLDEPTIGLDVTMQSTVRAFIRSYNERYGATVLLTSHYMADVAALCPRVLVIDRGLLIYDGALEELVRKTRPDKRVRLRFAQSVDQRDIDALDARVLEQGPLHALLQVDSQRLNDTVTRALARLPVVDLTVEDPPLEEVLSELFAASRAKHEGGA